MRMSDTNPIAVGSQIAPHLKLAAVLGEGGMARVFEAHHTRLNAPVAVKVLTLTGDGATQAGWRLVREARICARIEDAHIPRVYDVAELPDGRPYVVMEKVTGPTLEQYMLDGAPTVASVITVARELLLALKAVHRAGIVHRDVKPGNVILQRVHGRLQGVRLMDFGIAHVRAEAGDPSSMTSPGMLVGTPGYMAPEQVHADAVDARADLYSLGVLLYEMLTGSLPFTNPDSTARLRATVDENVPDVRRLRKDCPDNLAELVARATRRMRGERFASAEDMLEALDDCARDFAEQRAPARASTSWVRRAALMGVGACMVTGSWWVLTPANLPILRASDANVSSVAPEPSPVPARLEAVPAWVAGAGRAPQGPTRTEALSARVQGTGAQPAMGAVDALQPGAGEAAAGGSSAEPAEPRTGANTQPASASEATGFSEELPANEPRARRVTEQPSARQPPATQGELAAHAPRQAFDKGVLVSEYLRKLEALQNRVLTPAAVQEPARDPLGDEASSRAEGVPENPYDRP